MEELNGGNKIIQKIIQKVAVIQSFWMQAVIKPQRRLKNARAQYVSGHDERPKNYF